MPIDRPLFEPGDIVKHFKRETVSDLRSNDYLYKIVGEVKYRGRLFPRIDASNGF